MTKLSTGLQVLLGFFFVVSAVTKFTGGADDMQETLEVASWLWITIGIAELAGGVLLLASVWLRRLALPIAGAFTIFSLGAIAAHIRVGDFSGQTFAPVVLLVLFLAIVTIRANLFTMPESGAVNNR